MCSLVAHDVATTRCTKTGSSREGTKRLCRCKTRLLLACLEVVPSSGQHNALLLLWVASGTRRLHYASRCAAPGAECMVDSSVHDAKGNVSQPTAHTAKAQDGRRRGPRVL